jgi:Protein of unknown function (DUF1549)/Protein of unknown function (DUF1553)
LTQAAFLAFNLGMKSFAPIIVFLFFLPPLLTAEEDFRTWTNPEGQSMRAKLLAFPLESNQIEMEMEKGHKVKMSCGKFSVADREYLRSWQARQDFVQQIDTLCGAPPPQLSDSVFLNHAFLRISSKVPGPAETAAFGNDAAAGRRARLVDQLLRSKEFDEHLFVFLAPLLRADQAGSGPLDLPYGECASETGREQVQKTSRSHNPSPDPYREWVKARIIGNTPWNQMVRQILTESGPYPDNPAVGYFIPERKLSMIDPAPVLSAFAGVEITCARCHNHPHTPVSQLDHLRLAACFGSMRIESPNGEFPFTVSDGHRNRVLVPANYRHENADALTLSSPSVFFGGEIQLDAHDSPRAAFAAWLTSEKNPRFTLNIVNRLWKFAFSEALCEPVSHLPNRLDGHVECYPLLVALERIMVFSNYEPKTFLRNLFHTRAFMGE